MYAFVIATCGQDDEYFFGLTQRKLYGLMIGNNANNGAKTEYDDPGEVFGGDEIDGE